MEGVRSHRRLNYSSLTGEGGIFTPLIKQVVEAAMEREMDAHLSEIKANTKNRRNGHSKKQMKSFMGSFELKTPRDREGSFTPESVPKRQTPLPGDLDEKILGLYGLGKSYNDIQAHFREMNGINVSDCTINSITDRVIPVIRKCQHRILEPLSMRSFGWMLFTSRSGKMVR